MSPQNRASLKTEMRLPVPSAPCTGSALSALICAEWMPSLRPKLDAEPPAHLKLPQVKGCYPYSQMRTWGVGMGDLPRLPGLTGACLAAWRGVPLGEPGRSTCHKSTVLSTFRRAGTPGPPQFLQASNREVQAQVPSRDAMAWWQAEGRQGSLPVEAPK